MEIWVIRNIIVSIFMFLQWIGCIAHIYACEDDRYVSVCRRNNETLLFFISSCVLFCCYCDVYDFSNICVQYSHRKLNSLIKLTDDLFNFDQPKKKKPKINFTLLLVLTFFHNSPKIFIFTCSCYAVSFTKHFTHWKYSIEKYTHEEQPTHTPIPTSTHRHNFNQSE